MAYILVHRKIIYSRKSFQVAKSIQFYLKFHLAYNMSLKKKINIEINRAIIYEGTNPTEPANYTGSYTVENRVIIAGILKGVIN